MREVARIKRVMDLITEIWSMYPDMRFNQLINALQTNYDGGSYVRKAYEDDIGWGMKPVYYPSLFNVEDDKFEKFLIDYLDEAKKMKGSTN